MGLSWFTLAEELDVITDLRQSWEKKAFLYNVSTNEKMLFETCVCCSEICYRHITPAGKHDEDKQTRMHDAGLFSSVHPEAGRLQLEKHNMCHF